MNCFEGQRNKQNKVKSKWSGTASTGIKKAKADAWILREDIKAVNKSIKSSREEYYVYIILMRLQVS
jgi:hypothetical protein